MKKLTVVSLFDYSTYMLKPWFEAGHNCIAIDELHRADVPAEMVPKKFYATHCSGLDLNPPGKLQKALVWDVLSALSPDILFAFPPCTDLAVSGAKHFEKKRKKNPRFQEDAAELCQLAEKVAKKLKIPFMVENPISCLNTLWRKPDWLFHPHQYGGYLTYKDRQHPDWPQYVNDYDFYPKRTGIWCNEKFNMPVEKPARKPYTLAGSANVRLTFDEWVEFHPEDKTSKQFRLLGGSTLKTKMIRSLTPRGFANAVHLANDPNLEL